jgi:hypothetical protein
MYTSETYLFNQAWLGAQPMSETRICALLKLISSTRHDLEFNQCLKHGYVHFWNWSLQPGMTWSSTNVWNTDMCTSETYLFNQAWLGAQPMSATRICALLKLISSTRHDLELNQLLYIALLRTEPLLRCSCADALSYKVHTGRAKANYRRRVASNYAERTCCFSCSYTLKMVTVPSPKYR